MWYKCGQFKQTKLHKLLCSVNYIRSYSVKSSSPGELYGDDTIKLEHLNDSFIQPIDVDVIPAVTKKNLIYIKYKDLFNPEVFDGKWGRALFGRFLYYIKVVFNGKVFKMAGTRDSFEYKNESSKDVFRKNYRR